MANNINVTEGSGKTVATEDISSAQYQVIKVADGTAGGTTGLKVNTGGAINASVHGMVGASVIGLTPVNVVGSVYGTIAVTGNASVSGTVGASVIGTVPVVQSGINITSVVSTVPSSVLVGASIFGQLPDGTAVLGSIATLQGTTPWIISSVYGNISGSVVSFQGTNPLVIGSIVGTYAEDAGHTFGDKGLFAMGVRNDTLASVTSADNDYSQITVDPSGAVITHDAPITKWVQGTADLRVVLGASVTAIAPQGASVFTYIREIQVANMGSASVLVTFAGGFGSILGYTIAPAGGGSNFITRLKTGENSAFTASISGTASVLVSAQGFTAKI